MDNKVDDDLRLIKKFYGEKMAHFCKKVFPTLLDKQGLLYSLFNENFAHNKFLYDDLVVCKMFEDFKNYIYSLAGLEIEKKIAYRTPNELLDEAGYILYECHNEEEIQSFKKYYVRGEELCTFDGGRLKRCHVFFAVKKNVDEIRREDFIDPHRQDLYGTSVISIQFSRGNINTLSIKNRYNHTLDRTRENPDATFANNLENIIPGLTDSFEKEYGFHIDSYDKFPLEIPGYVKANDGKYYRYNYEINDIYYCMDNVMVYNGYVIPDYLDKSRYILFDYFIIDLKDKKVFLYDKNINDTFIDTIHDIDVIDVDRNESGNKIVRLVGNDCSALIEINSEFKFVGYKNDTVKEIGNQFLFNNIFLKHLDLSNVSKIGNGCLSFNEYMSDVNLPKIEEIGISFLTSRKYSMKPYGVINISNDYSLGFNSMNLSENSGLRK